MKRAQLRADPERVREWLNRSRRRLPAESAKRRAERAARAQVRAATLERAGWRCQAAELVPEVRCRGPLDVDERTARGTHPGSHLDLEVTQALCRAHHEWKGDHPAAAEQLGLRVRSST